MTTMTDEHTERKDYQKISRFQPVKKRWTMLAISTTFFFIAIFQRPQYVCISSVVQEYYNVSGDAVDNTYVVFFMVYVVLILPVITLLNKIGTRYYMIAASAGVSLGACIRIYASLNQGRFLWIMIAQFIEAVFQVITFSLNITVVSSWFGADEVAFALSISTIGCQLGVAFGYFLPIMIVGHPKSPAQTEAALTFLNVLVACASTAVFLSSVFFFENEPKQPPSAAQAYQKEAKRTNIVSGVTKALHGVPFIAIMVIFSVNVGCNSTYDTLLNTEFNKEFSNIDSAHLAYVGIVTSAAGFFGSLSSGYILDKTRKFKEIFSISYFLSGLSMIACCASLRFANLKLLYISSVLKGYFMSVQFTSGVQMGFEINFPLREMCTATVLEISVNVFSSIITKIYRRIYDNNAHAANGFICVLLLVGGFIAFCIPLQMKRQDIENSAFANERRISRRISVVNFQPLLVMVESPEVERRKLCTSSTTTEKDLN